MTEPCTLENGFEACMFCWCVFGGEDDPERHLPYPSISGGVNYTHGPVVHAETGREYDHVGASPPGTPLAHPECYKRWAEATNDTDATLDEYL